MAREKPMMRSLDELGPQREAGAAEYQKSIRRLADHTAEWFKSWCRWELACAKWTTHAQAELKEGGASDLGLLGKLVQEWDARRRCWLQARSRYEEVYLDFFRCAFGDRRSADNVARFEDQVASEAKLPVPGTEMPPERVHFWGEMQDKVQFLKDKKNGLI